MILAWCSRHCRAMEVIGLVLVLAAAAWQLFLEDQVRSFVAEGQLVGEISRLNAIWHAIGSDNPQAYVKANDKFVDVGIITTTDMKAIRTAHEFALIRFGIFGVGSVLLILSKVFAPKNR